MRILVYGINYAPELTGIGKYTGEMCEWLVSQGHQVKVITAPPYYPAWKIAPGYRSLSYQRERKTGLSVLRCPLWVPAQPSGLKRIVHLLSFALSSLFPVLANALTWRPQVVLVVEPPFFCAPSTLLAARLSGAKSWLHIQDLEIDAAFALGLISSPLLKCFMGQVERLIMSAFDRVTTVSKSMLANIRVKGIAPEKSGLFANWVDTRTIYPLPRASALRCSLGISEDSVVVLYSGNMGAKQGLEIVLEAAQLLRDQPAIIFVLCGDGAVRPQLESQAARLEHVRFLPLQPLEMLNELLNLADIQVIPQRPDVESLVMPSKLLGILASGRPVVAVTEANCELGAIVAQCGLVVPPGKPAELANALTRLAGDPELRRNLGRQARSLCQRQWDSDAVLERFQQELAAVLD
jgi:colanic acid biosynthesis glycosyl transferase WcaI